MRINPIAKALGLLGALSFATYSFAAETRTITLNADEEPISYSRIFEEVEQINSWEEGDFFSLEIVKKSGTGAAYAVYDLAYGEAFDATVFVANLDDEVPLVIYPKRLSIVSNNIGIVFPGAMDESSEPLESVSSFSIGCDAEINASTAVSQAENVIGILIFSGTPPETYEDFVSEKPKVKIQGNYEFSQGTLLFDSVDATLIGQGEIGSVVLEQLSEDKDTIVEIREDLASAKRSALLVGELGLTQGTLVLSGENFGTILQVKNLSVGQTVCNGSTPEGTGGTIHIKEGAALVLGNPTISRNGEQLETNEAVIRYLGDLYVKKGSARPTLIVDSTTPVVSGDDTTTLTVQVGTVNSDTINALASSEEGQGGRIIVGSDGRLALLYQSQSNDVPTTVANVLTADESETESLSTSTLTIQHEAGAQLEINGWDGTEANVDLEWEAENISFSDVKLGRAQAVQIEGGFRIERRYMQNLAGLKSYNAVKVAEDGLYAGTLSSAGVELIRAAINESNLGDLAFVDLVDSTVFLPLASGLHVLTERAFDSAHTQMMTRSMARTTERDHWWVSANRETHRIPNMGLKGKVTSVLLGADRSLTANWSASIAVGGSKIDSTQSGLVYGIKGDTAFANASIFAERELPGDSKLRLGVTVGRAELTTKRTVLGHTVKSEPVIKMFGVGARYSTSYTGQKTSITPFIGLNGYTAKFSDGDVTDQGEFSGVHGAGFKTTAKKRIWGDVTAGFTADATWEPFVDCFVRPRMALLGKVAFGDRKWKAASTLATQTSAPDYDTFQSTPLWSVAAEIGLNIAASKKVPIKEGGFLGFGGEDTGKDAMKDWQFDLKIGYRRAEKSEHSSYIGFEYRENW